MKGIYGDISQPSVLEMWGTFASGVQKEMTP